MGHSPVIKGQNHTKFQQNYFKSFLAFLDSLVCVLASQKKFIKIFVGESTENDIYKMAAITKCEILKSVHTVFPACVLYKRIQLDMYRMYLSMYYPVKIQNGRQMCKFVFFGVVHTK